MSAGLRKMRSEKNGSEKIQNTAFFGTCDGGGVEWGGAKVFLVQKAEIGPYPEARWRGLDSVDVWNPRRRVNITQGRGYMTWGAQERATNASEMRIQCRGVPSFIGGEKRR